MKTLRITAVALMGLLGFFAGPADAQQSPPASECAPGGPEPRPGPQYPPRCASPQASPTSVRAGEAIRLTGQCPASGTVDFRIQPGGISLGSTQTNNDGFFDRTVTTPSTLAPGSYTIEYRCTAVLGAQFERAATIQVLPAAAARAGGGTLPRTGSGTTLPLALGGSLLIGLGAAAVTAVRRRRTASV